MDSSTRTPGKPTRRKRARRREEGSFEEGYILKDHEVEDDICYIEGVSCLTGERLNNGPGICHCICHFGMDEDEW